MSEHSGDEAARAYNPALNGYQRRPRQPGTLGGADQVGRVLVALVLWLLPMSVRGA